MDLGLINHKLVNDEYEGREQFVEDLRLVFSNAVEFNRPAAQQAQSQQELNPHFVMDDLAAKTYAIATHLLNYVDHLELECFTVSKFKLYFNLRFVVVSVRCSSPTGSRVSLGGRVQVLTHWLISTQVPRGSVGWAPRGPKLSQGAPADGRTKEEGAGEAAVG